MNIHRLPLSVYKMFKSLIFLILAIKFFIFAVKSNTIYKKKILFLAFVNNLNYKYDYFDIFE